MRASRNRDLHLIPTRQRITEWDARAVSKDRRKRLPVPVIRTSRPATLELTGQKIDQILFG